MNDNQGSRSFMGPYHHIKLLRRSEMMCTYTASHAEHGSVILRTFKSSYFSEYGGDYDLSSEVLSLIPDLLYLMSLPESPGIARWIDFEVIDPRLHLRFVRAYYPFRLLDLIIPAPQHPPSESLLHAFEDLATGFDHIEHHNPQHSFFFHPHNLLSDGVNTVIADYGLVDLFNATEGGYIESRVMEGFSWHMQAAGCYPHYSPMALISAHPTHVRPVFALASLYVLLRTGQGAFYDQPLPSNTGFIGLQQFFDQHSLAQSYHNTGTIKLTMLSQSEERQVLEHALSSQSDFSSCAALMKRLRSIWF